MHLRRKVTDKWLSSDFTTFLLPGGYVDEQGVLHREVDLAPLSGREEELLADCKRRPGRRS